MQGGRHQGGQRGTGGRAAVLGPRVPRRPRARRCRTHGDRRSFNHKTIASADGEIIGSRADYNNKKKKNRFFFFLFFFVVLQNRYTSNIRNINAVGTM